MPEGVSMPERRAEALYARFMDRVLEPIASLDPQVERLASASSYGELTDADLLWVLAGKLAARGTTGEAENNIVEHLRHRVRTRTRLG